MQKFINLNAWIINFVFLIILVVMYYLWNYRQFRKEQKRILELQNSLSVGDKVMLSAGFHAIIKSLEKKSAVVEIGEQQIVIVTINRFAITGKI